MISVRTFVNVTMKRRAVLMIPLMNDECIVRVAPSSDSEILRGRVTSLHILTISS
jgi:hypothetical protein